MKTISVVLVFLIISACSSNGPSMEWGIGPFKKANDHNPVMLPRSDTKFFCPVRKDTVSWEQKDVFNPSSVVKDDTLFMIYRAEDTVGIHNGTSRLGLSFSFNGYDFIRLENPVLYPDNDKMNIYEWEGGIEDPRIVRSESGTFIMTYTSYDGMVARLCVASSINLRNWTKHGLAFTDPKYEDLWSKSGSIAGKWLDGSITAKKINGKYWMYFGDTDIFAATSDDLINWEPVVANGELFPVFGPRKGMFDSRLVEPGPPAIITEHGIMLLYNSMNLDEGGDPALPAGNYSASQILLDIDDPTKVIDRKNEYFITPEYPYEKTGQIGNVCFIEGLSFYKGKYFLYYGTADSKIAVTVAE